jgi:hypothetical protein
MYKGMWRTKALVCGSFQYLSAAACEAQPTLLHGCIGLWYVHILQCSFAAAGVVSVLQSQPTFEAAFQTTDCRLVLPAAAPHRQSSLWRGFHIIFVPPWQDTIITYALQQHKTQ